jgi:hypothetical protein
MGRDLVMKNPPDDYEFPKDNFGHCAGVGG